MSIVLVGSTSGSVTLQEPAVAGTTVLTLPAVSGTVITTGSPQSQSVIQVVQPTPYTTPFSTSSGTAVSTGFSATITPTFASSRILIIAYSSLGVPTSGMNGRIDLRRGTSTTIVTDFYVTFGAADYLNAAFTGVYLDSPSTTSATTYYLYAYRDGAAGTFYVGARRDNFNPLATTITLMEIAA